MSETNQKCSDPDTAKNFLNLNDYNGWVGNAHSWLAYEGMKIFGRQSADRHAFIILYIFVVILSCMPMNHSSHSTHTDANLSY